MPVRVRLARARAALLVLVAVLLGALTAGQGLLSTAAFDGITVNDGDSWAAATLQPPTGVTVTATCVADDTSLPGPAPSLRSSASATAAASSSVAVPVPAGVQAGDLLLASIAWHGGPSPFNVTPPTGWTALRTDTQPGVLTAMTYYRRAGTSEPASYTWSLTTSHRASVGMAAYTGVSTANPVNAHSGQWTSGSTSLAAPSVTTTVADTRLVATYATASDVTFTPPSGMTERWDQRQSSGPSQTLVDAARAATGATGARAAVASSSVGGFSQLVALAPTNSSPKGEALAAPQYRHRTTSTSDKGPLALARPTTFANDLLLAQIAFEKAPLPSSITPPTGWILLRSDTAGSGDSGTTVLTYYRVATSSEPSSYSWNWTSDLKAGGGITSYSGVDPLAPIHAHSGVWKQASTTQIVAPTVPTAVANTLVVGQFTVAKDASFTPPTGMLERWDLKVSGSLAVTSSDAARAATGQTGHRTATPSSSGPGFGQQIVLAPLRGPEPPPSSKPYATVSWTATSSSPVDGYLLERLRSSTVEDEEALEGRFTTTATDGPLLSSTAYTYRLVTIAGSWSSVPVSTSVTTPPC